MKIKKKTIIFIFNIFICLIFFNVHFISQVPILNMMVDVLRIVFFAIFLFKWLIKGKVKKIQIFVIILFVSRCVSTLMNGDSLMAVITLFFPIITMMLYIDLNQDNLPILIKSIFISSGTLVLINTITLILFPEGIYSINHGYLVYWFIGQKQDWNIVYIAFFISSIILWNERKYKITAFIVYAMMIYSFTVQVPLGLIIYFLVVVTLILLAKRKFFKTKTMFLINAIFEIAIIVMGYLFESLSWLKTLLLSISTGEIMTKQDTFLVRVNMWKDGLEQFMKQPILGLGNVSEERWGMLFNYSTYHPNFHNMPIDVLVTSGLIGIVAFVYIYFYVAKQLDKSRTRHAVLLTYGIFGINVFMLSEVVYAPFTWFFIFLGYYILKLDMAIKTEEYVINEKRKKR